MNLKVVKEAEAELDEAIAYYEEKESGLGLRFKEETRSAMEWIETISICRVSDRKVIAGSI